MIWIDKNSKKKFYAGKKPIKIWDVNVKNIVIPKLVKIKPNSKYCIGYLDKAIRSLVLIMPKMIHLKLKKEIRKR